MNNHAVRLGKRLALLVAAALAVSASQLAGVAQADSMPPDPTNPLTPATVAADPLPTAQIDGVAWTQKIVGNTVYVGGEFTSARPAGAAPGVNTVARSNLLAYDLTTGVLNTSWAPTTDGAVQSITASPDGSRIYVGGAFTKVNGLIRNRIAALNPSTGALIDAFQPKPDATVRAIVATNSTVYFGGLFSAVGGQTRTKVASASASNGALLSWAPNLQGGLVRALALSPDGAKLVMGGSFTSANGSSNPGYGLAAVDSSTAASVAFPANDLIRNGGPQSAITSLSSDSDSLYATGYTYGAGGNLEGTARINWSDLSTKWVEDCHGDTYSAYPAGDAIYTVSHAHYCGNLPDGFGQSDPWTFHWVQAFSKAVAGTLKADPLGYFNWQGTPAPNLQKLFPVLASGTYTGQGQAGWTVTGNGTYVAVGGEFPTAGGTTQQGLVRYAVKSVAPNKLGPVLTGSKINPTVTSYAKGTVKISWPANWDRDNEKLSYSLVRNSVIASPIYTADQVSSEWSRPSMGFLDTGLTPGQTYKYRLYVKDPFGNQAVSDTVTVTVSNDAISPYAQSVLSDGAANFWRLGESSGTGVTDWAGFNAATAGSGVTRGTAGAIGGDINAASTFDGTGNGLVYPQSSQAAPDAFSTEAWFKTTSTSGGKIIGFGSVQSGGESSTYDRHVYMTNSGKLAFGVFLNGVRTVESAKSFNDGEWHHVVATLGAAGMTLYADGTKVGGRTDTVNAGPSTGYWRIGGDNLGGWPDASSSNYFSGSIDDVAVYPTALSVAQVRTHFTNSGRTVAGSKAPSDAYGAAVYGAEPDLYWRLDETTGTTANDATMNGQSGTYAGGATQGGASAVSATNDKSVTFDGSDGAVASNTAFDSPTTFAEELWFNTTTTRGGKLIGFGSSQVGSSSSYDRHVYMFDDGRLRFGAYNGNLNVVDSAKAYNDGKWHHLVAQQSGAGMSMYVDSDLVGTNPATDAQPYQGYWRVGGDNTWGGSSSNYFAGLMDEVAVYSKTLTVAQIQDHYTKGGGTVNVAPTAAVDSVMSKKVVALDASGSSDPDGTIASYAWDFGDGSTGTGVKPTHTYASVGSFSVRLTVTDDRGATDASTKTVTTVAGVGPKDAYGKAVFGSDPYLYWRLDETSGSTANDSGDNAVSGTYSGGATQGGSSAVGVTGDSSVGLDGNDGAVASNSVVDNPTSYAEELWFNTTTARGGKLIGLGSSQFGGSGGYDRHVYMFDDGRLRFGTYTGQLNVIDSAKAYNDGRWHHLVAQQSGDGMAMYVDDELVGTNPQTQAQDFSGYWRVGGDNTWGGASSNYFAGSIDEVAVYAKALTVAQIQDHYTKGGGLAANVVPTAAFEATVSNKVVAFDGSASSDTDGTVASYAWDFGDGTTGTGPTPKHTYATVDSFPVKLTVTDDRGGTGATTKTVTTTASPAPTAAFTSSVSKLTATFDASGSSDPDGTVESYLWDFGDGTSGTAPKTSHTYATPGDKTVTLTVTDNDGVTGSVTRKVTPIASTAPTAAFTSSVNKLVAAFDGSGSSDSDGTVVAYAWDFGDGTTSTTAKPSHTYATTGDKTVTLTVTDDDGVIGSATKTVAVTGNAAPKAVFTSKVAKLAVTFDGSGSNDSDGAVVSYAWDFGDGASSAVQKPSHTYASAGDKTVTLKVTDDDGATDTSTTTVTTVANTAPKAALTSTVSGLTVSFDGSGSADADGAVTAYAWSFGDGTSSTDVKPSHTYASGGDKSVSLTVTDDDGATDKVTKTVTAVAPVTGPLASDAFGRSVSNGWGNADTGGSYTRGGTASAFSVTNGAGQILLSTPGAGPSMTLSSVSSTSSDVLVKVTMDKIADGGGSFVSVGARATATNDYRAKVKVASNGALTLYLVKVVGGTETTLSSVALGSSFSYATGAVLNVRVEATGTAPTTVRARVWKSTQSEPTSWQLSTTDSTDGLQQAGGASVVAYLASSATNQPIAVRFDDLKVTRV